MNDALPFIVIDAVKKGKKHSQDILTVGKSAITSF
jgi:hypothetical protein